MEAAASGDGIIEGVDSFEEPEAKEKHEIENKPVNGAAKEEEAEDDRTADKHKLGGIGKFLPGPQRIKKYRKKAHQGKEDNAPPDQHKNQRITNFETWL
jgi:hypothetical protein